MGFLKARETISGEEAKLITIIDGNVEEAFYIKTFEANFEKNKVEIKTIGKRGTQHKAAGWSGTGSMNIHYATTIFRQMALKYIRTGVDTYFDLICENDDPNSSLGKQTVVLYNVNLDSTTLAVIDLENESLDEDVDFTFDDFDILDSFGKPILG